MIGGDEIAMRWKTMYPQQLPLEADPIEVRTNPMYRKLPPAVLAAVRNERLPVPRAMILSSLFQVRKRAGVATPRPSHFGKVLVAVDGIEVRYTGAQLDQDDLLVYMEVIGLIAHVSSDGLIQVDISPAALLTRLGWSPNVANYERLRATLTRLQATSINVRGNRMEGAHRVTYEYGGSLLPEYTITTINQRAKMTLGFSADLVRLFWAGVIGIHRHVLRELGGSHMARWAYSFFVGDSQPRDWSLRRLRELSGSQASARRFRGLLEESLRDIQAAGVGLEYAFNAGRGTSREASVRVSMTRNEMN